MMGVGLAMVRVATTCTRNRNKRVEESGYAETVARLGYTWMQTHTLQKTL